MGRPPKRPPVVIKPPEEAPTPSLIPPVIYKTPLERPTRDAFVSSVVSGNTEEGGLRSVTYKSIEAVKFVENLELVRNTLIKDDFEAPHILEKDYVTEDLIAHLRAEVSTLTSESTRNTHVDESVERLNGALDDELSRKAVSSQYGDQLKHYYSTENPDVNLRISNSTYQIKRINVDLPVESASDVRGEDHDVVMAVA